MSLPMGTLARPSMGSAQSRAELTSRHDELVKEDRQTLIDRAKAYRIVNGRDENTCRACRVKVSPFAANRNHRREHNHVNGRGFDRAETTENIHLICRACHELRHVKRTLKISGDADGLLRFQIGKRIWHG